MQPSQWTFAAVALTALVHGATLDSVCTAAHVKASLPNGDFYAGVGITVDPSSVEVNSVTGASVTGENMYPDAMFDYCNVTFAYSHTGRNDTVHVTYWLPTPSNFQNRYLSTGGGGLAINSGNMSLPGGIIYGAVAGTTDGGFGSFDTNFDQVFLVENGTVNWESVFMFGYQGIHELSALGKAFTKSFFSMNSTKLYSYYQACSEGGREGWSQIQRFPNEWDGAVTGAPAFRYSFQQVQHLYSNVVEKTLDYYPSPCELDEINNLTIKACDPLDGKTDGVVARTDLCKLHFDYESIVGKPYYCAASPAGGFGPTGPAPATPAQNGTITQKGVQVAKTIVDGLKDTQGRRVYLSYQPAASFVDAATQYDNATQSWGLEISALGAEWVTRYLELLNTSTILPSQFEDVTYDTLKDWMIQGWQMYEDTLQTNWPDLTPFHEAGGKVIHYHGESDNSIPTASSVRYYESVRKVMYPELSFNASQAALSEWYKLFLIPGAEHCAPNPDQPNGPFPQTNLAVLIDWVENGNEPKTLNATVLQGEHQGDNAQICAWPLRPFWSGNGTDMTCEYDQASFNTWVYDLNAIKLPVY